MAVIQWITDETSVVSTTLIFVAVFLFVAYIFERRKYKHPPGPWRLPIIGSIPFLGKKPLNDEIAAMVTKYNSDIIGFQMGSINAVVVNSYEKIKETFLVNGDEISDRSSMFLPTILSGRNGLLHVNGKLWKEQRRHALTVLRNFGMGKMAAEERINNEVAYMIEAIDAENGGEFDPFNLLTITISNIICAIAFGKRYNYDDKEFRTLVKALNELASQTTFTGLIFIFPAIRFLPGDYFNVKGFQDTIARVTALAQSHVTEHKARFNPSNIDDFIDAYFAEMERMNNKVPPVNHSFTDTQLTSSLRDLFFAGTETTSSTLRWALALMVNHPDVQTKVQTEIDDQIGSDHVPQMKDRLTLPYTEAVVMEVQRFASLVALGIPHSNTERDIKLYSYDVPKDSLIFANLYGVHHDPKIWPYPDSFDPRNFIDENGSLRNQEYLIPFAIGKRSCPGEGLAKMEIFIVFTSIMQAYTILPSSEGTPILDNITANLRTPPFYKIKLQRRLAKI